MRHSLAKANCLLDDVKFPDDVIVALHEGGVTVTCLPIQLDDGAWQAAIFYVVPIDSPMCDGGKRPAGPYAVQFEADLFEHDNGTVFELGIEIRVPDAPLAGSLLFLTGHASAHFDVLQLLVSQSEVPLFIGDPYCTVIAQQRVPLSDAHRTGLRALIHEAVRRDAVVRMSGHYDADAAFAAAAKRHAVSTTADVHET